MRDPDNKFDPNSTWEALPRRPLLLKFLASLVLFGFLLGLMLGQLLHPTKPINDTNPVVQLLTYADGLGVCLKAPTQVQTAHTQGVYQLWFADSSGRDARGEIILAEGPRITWRLEQQASGLLVTFIGLQAVQGQWQARQTTANWCADIQISAAQ